jgi:hypothetical protein
MSYTAATETITWSEGAKHNYCMHTRTGYQYPAQGTITGITWNIGYPTKKALITKSDIASEECRLYGIEGHGSWWPSVAALAFPSWEYLDAKALMVMWPAVESELSSLNSVYELREMKKLPKQVAKLARQLFSDGALSILSSRSKIGRALRDLSPEYRLKKFAEYARQTRQGFGSGFLLKEFGIDPLVSDVRTLFGIAERARASAQRILDNEHKLLKSHARFWVPVPTTTDHSYTITSEALGASNVRRRVVEYAESWYTATMEYSYSVPQGTKQHLQLLSLLDTLGVNINPGIVWEAVPWSFVVDWLVGVQPWLEQFTLRAVRPAVKVHHFVHSYKGRRTTTRYFTCCSNRGSSGEMKIGVREELAYTRKPHIPNFYSSLQTSGITNREILLASALVAAR